MKEDYIVLPFSVPEPIYFKLGDYVDLSGVLDDSLGGLLSKVYEIVDLQKPAFNTSTGGYDYQLRMDAYYWKWKNKIFKYTPEHAGYEASWSLTAALDVQLGVFLRNLKALGYTYKGKEFVFEIDSTVENKAVAMTYDNMNLLDALFSMAGEDKWNCDCWITDNVIHFGRNEFGDAVKIELWVEASAMTRSESKGTYATRIYAFGSTRNIPENYRPIEEQTVVNGVVQRRLMLPAGTPYIDVYPDMSQEEAIEDIVVFDEVYPRLESTMSSVSTRTETVTNEDGGQETVTYYRYRDTGLNFSKDYILPGQELTIIFQSGKMNGLEFGVIFDPDNNGSQLWEIVRSEDYGRPLPDDTIYPENDDKYILSGFDPKFVSVQMIPDAEQELKEKAQKIADQRKKDDGTYYTTLRSEWVNEDKLKRFFEFGQKINLVNKAFFENGRESRVLGWEFNLDIPWDSPVYTIGESMPYSRLNDVEEKLESITYKGHTYVGGGGNGIYVIKTNDSTAPSDSNVFSAKRSLATLLRKDKEDQTNYLIKLLGGIISPFLESIDFVTGMMGAGMSFSSEKGGESVGWIDKLYVRKKAIFQLLSIMETELAGASFMFNASGARATITKVEFIEKKGIRFKDGKGVKFSDGKRGYSSPGTYGSVYRCYFLADDGEKAIENRFKPGNLVRSQSFNIKEGAYEGVSNHYWWRLVENVGDNYIDVSVSHCDEGSDIPKVGDVMVQLGDIADPDYQAAIVLSAYGDGAPYLTFYQGINSYSLSERDILTARYDRVTKECRFQIGHEGKNGCFLYSPSKGLRVEGMIEVLGGNGMSNFDDALDFAEQINDRMAQYIGYDGWESLVGEALAGRTIIKGGVINTSLINVNSLFAGDIYAGNATISEGTFKKINVEEANIANSTLTDVNVTGTINANAGYIGGFKIENSRLSYNYSDNNSTSPAIIINVDTNESFRINENPTSNGPFMQVRSRKRQAINIFTGGGYSDDPSAIYVVCNASGYGKAIESYGNVKMTARSGENININGLALNVRTVSSSTTLTSGDDIIISTTDSNITLNLPRSGHTGKIIWIRKSGLGNITVSGNGLQIKGSNEFGSGGWHDSVQVANGQLWMFICTGGVWYANCLT